MKLGGFGMGDLIVLNFWARSVIIFLIASEYFAHKKDDERSSKIRSLMYLCMILTALSFICFE